MVHQYIKKTNDWTFLTTAMPLLEQEMEFFEEARSLDVTVDGKELHRVFRYCKGCSTY